LWPSPRLRLLNLHGCDVGAEALAALTVREWEPPRECRVFVC
jgi:hypothetical protein